MSGDIYGQAYEYLSVLRSTNQILNRITQEFNIDPMTNWRVLKHLRGFNQKQSKSTSKNNGKSDRTLPCGGFYTSNSRKG